MKMNLPEEFLARIREMLKDEFLDFLKSYATPARRGIRINSLKTTAEEIREQAPFYMEPVPWIKDGFFIGQDADPAGHPFYRAGLYYIQEPSAMTPADRLEIRPGDRVLDLCAAPGGKATALAAKLAGTGLLVANDASTSRCRALLHNLELFGADNIIVTNEQPFRLAERFPEFFDRILVDAPCSGEGMFNKEPEVIGTWSPERVAYFAAQQRSILKSAVRMLKEGGLLMYSTCTFSKEENEGSVSALLEVCPEMRLEEIRPYEGFACGRPEWGNGSADLEKTVRIWPHRMDGAGHFMALLRKEENDRREKECRKAAGFPEDEGFRKEKGNQKSGKGDRFGKPAGSGRDGKGGRFGKPAGSGRDGKTGRSGKQAGFNHTFNKEEREIMEAFLAQMNAAAWKPELENRGGKVYRMSFGREAAADLRFLRCGLYMGELKKKRFEPSQAMALYYGAAAFQNALDLRPDDPRTDKYLAGEDIRLNDEINRPDSREADLENGLVLVKIGGFAVGFGKKTGALLKNRYLRLK